MEAIALHSAPTRYPSRRPSVSVVVPCYNEQENVARLAEELDALGRDLAPSYELELVFVDDGSTDDTFRRLERHFGGRSDCLLVPHARNRGIAAAVMTGIQRATSDVVCSIDSDCTYDPRQLAHALPLLTGGVDALTASPYHPQGRVRGVSEWRLALSRLASSLYRGVMRQKLSCYTSCFRVYRRSAVAGIELDNPRFVGIAETLWRLDRQGSRIAEWPAELTRRRRGQSKINLIGTTIGHLSLLVRILAANAADLLMRRRVPLRPVPDAIPPEHRVLQR